MVRCFNIFGNVFVFVAGFSSFSVVFDVDVDVDFDVEDIDEECFDVENIENELIL